MLTKQRRKYIFLQGPDGIPNKVFSNICGVKRRIINKAGFIRSIIIYPAYNVSVCRKILCKGELDLNGSLLDSLREGGYILYSRHGEATVGMDQPNLNFLYCYTQRNLSDLGRRQAVYYGELIRALQIPVEYPVIASPFCRTVETAQLAFGREYVQIDPLWVEAYNLSRNITQSEQKRILDILRSKLETIPALGTNQVIIAHSFPDTVGLGQIPDMGTVIIRPLGRDNGFEIIARLSLNDLANLQRTI